MRQFPCFLTLLLFCSTLPILAQDTLPVVLRGRVTDAQTGAPLPSASVSVPSHRIHTTTNSAGMFLIKLPAGAAGDSAFITRIGYSTLRFQITSQSVGPYVLIKQSIALPEVSIQSISPRNLIAKAIEHIPDNYFSRPHVLRGFYRLSSRKGGDFFHISEAAYDCWHPDGTGRQRKLSLLKARVEQDFTPFNGSENIIMGMQPNALLEFDFAAHISEHPVLGRKGMEEHVFRLAGITPVNGRGAWEIKFEQRDGLRKSRYQGSVYIDTASYAFVSLTTRLSPKGIQYWEVSSASQRALMKLLNIYEQTLQDTLTIHYLPSGGKYFVGDVHSSSRMRLYSPRLRFDFEALSRVDFITTRIDTTPALPFNPTGVVGRHTFIENHSSLDTSDFWKDYNMLPSDYNTDSVAIAIRSRQSSVQYKQQMENRLRRMPRNKIAQLDSLFTFYHNKRLFDGVASVQWNGELLYQKAFGQANREERIPNDTATVFRIGSVSKQFTAMLVMLLREEGKLSLDDSAGRFLPGFAHGGVTIGQLLTHRSGIPDYTTSAAYLPGLYAGPQSMSDIITKYCQDSALFVPGSQFRYSNSGYAVLAAIVEKAAGMPFGEALQQKICIPLGMRHTSFGLPPENGNTAKGYEGPMPEIAPPAVNTPGAGGIFSSAPDLRKWENALTSCRLIPCERILEMMEPRADYADWHAGYGYGWMTDRLLFRASRKHIVHYHPGTDVGFFSMEVRQPDKGITITMLCNNGDFPRFDLTDLVLEILN